MHWRSRWGAAIFLVPALAMATEPVMLMPIDITAERPSPLQAQPESYRTTVSSEELKAINAATVSGTLKYQPGLTVRQLMPGDNREPCPKTHEPERDTYFQAQMSLKVARSLGSSEDDRDTPYPRTPDH